VIARQESGLGLLSHFDSVLANAGKKQPHRFSAHVQAPRATRLGDEGTARERD
jgi:hypothetical protein